MHLALTERRVVNEDYFGIIAAEMLGFRATRVDELPCVGHRGKHDRAFQLPKWSWQISRAQGGAVGSKEFVRGQSTQTVWEQWCLAKLQAGKFALFQPSTHVPIDDNLL